MIYLDGFSGYGGFRKGFEEAGWKFDKVYFSEIDKYAIANYKYNFPGSEWVGSISTLPDIGPVDIFTFGWPCQDNSIGGDRKGQRPDTRSGLLFKSVEAIERFKPRNFVAENVVGLLSVNEGIDIIKSLELLAFLNDSLPQYDIEMQLFNTLWYLPQNRARLYFVGHLRGSSSRKVFPIEARNEVHLTEGPTEIKTYMACLTTRSGKTRRSIDMGYVLTKDERIRDLTPIERERLQGLPDNWTRYGEFNGAIKELSDTQRVKLCGNGVSVPIIKEIAEKLKP